MKNWWLELYTIPALKVLFKAFLIVFIATALMAFFLPHLLWVMAGVTLYLSFVMHKEAKTSINANVEFHKLHVAYPLLRNAMLTDIVIRVVATMVAVFCCFCLIVTFSMGAEDSFFIGATIPFHAILIFGMTSFNKIINGKFRFQMYNTDQLPKILHFLLSCSYFLVGSVWIMVVTLAGFDPMILTGYCVVAYIGFYFVYTLRALFHKEEEKGSFKTMVKYTSKGMALGLGAFVVTALSFRPFINDHDLTADSRIFMYNVAGPIAPYLEVATVKEMMAENMLMEDRVTIFKGADPEVFQLPVFSIFDKPSVAVLHAYIAAAEKPTIENMKMILEYNTRVKADPKHKSALVDLVAFNWPKHEKFPEQYLDQKLRAPASTK